MSTKILPYSLDWGSFTTDGYNSDSNEALQVYNIRIQEGNKNQRIISFIAGRAAWGTFNLPTNCKQKIIIDVRGQLISDTSLELLIDKLSEALKNKAISNFSIELLK